jgi:hypothetical protein
MTAGDRTNDFPHVIRRASCVDPDIKSHPPATFPETGTGLIDSIICTPEDAGPTGQYLFDRIRWGGQAIVVCPSQTEATKSATEISTGGFEVTQKPNYISRGFLNLPIPVFSRKIDYFVVRKVELVRPGQTTERFTYNVHLERDSQSGEYIVVKEVPTLEMVMNRLRTKWPDLGNEILEKRARKFSDKIFPVFLTREAAILKIVNRDLPEQYRSRVPRLLEMEKDERGYASRLHLSWLRNGGEPLSQLEFARQSADLLRALHDDVGVMHLDLRLDNFVITPDGVGFVDFGSAVRVDENLKQSPLLSNLFEELMHTSEIQRMLFRMTRTGEVTSEAISGGLHKVDKAVDYFYLAVQISSPHTNPDLKDLIRWEKQSPEAKLLSRLTDQILRPADPTKPAFRSAGDILHGIEQLKQPQADTQRAEPPAENPDLAISKNVPPT